MRNKVLTKEKLIEVAENIIKEEGLDACTSRNIAKHANCALGTIYNYFDSRDSFLEQVFIQSWDKTKVKLSLISDLEISTKEKALKMFRLVEQDVKDRSGIGDYLFETVFKCENKKSLSEKTTNNILDIFIKILKESEKNSNLDDVSLRISAEWIYYGTIVLIKKEKDVETFYRLAIERFF